MIQSNYSTERKKSGQKKPYLIDTNVFLELLLNRAFKNDCARLLKEVEIGNLEAYVSSFSIHSIEVILSNFNKQKELKIFLSSIMDFEGLAVYSTNMEEELEAIDEMEKGLDFDDALQSFIAKRLKDFGDTRYTMRGWDHESKNIRITFILKDVLIIITVIREEEVK